MFEARQTDELVRIAQAGGGFEINIGARQADEIVRIALAGKGNVFFAGLPS